MHGEWIDENVTLGASTDARNVFWHGSLSLQRDYAHACATVWSGKYVKECKQRAYPRIYIANHSIRKFIATVFGVLDYGELKLDIVLYLKSLSAYEHTNLITFYNHEDFNESLNSTIILVRITVRNEEMVKQRMLYTTQYM